MTAKRAATISIKELADHVDKAAAKAPGADKLDKGLVVDWTIIGRYLLEHSLPLADAIKTAESIAHDVASVAPRGAAAAAAAPKLEPAVLASHGRIILGFFPSGEFGVRVE